MKDFDRLFALLKEWAERLDYAPIIDLMASSGDSPWQILVSTMLSARTKDEVTANASRKLFRIAETPEKTLNLSIAEIEKLIYPVGFYHTKAKNLLLLAKVIADKNGTVPKTLDELTQLPGIGVKTATLVMIKAYGIEEICVDTHVHRISNLWGLVKTDTPEKTWIALKKALPRKYWRDMNQYLVTLGQLICRPAKRECDKCPVVSLCPATRQNKILTSQ